MFLIPIVLSAAFLVPAAIAFIILVVAVTDNGPGIKLDEIRDLRFGIWESLGKFYTGATWIGRATLVLPTAYAATGFVTGLWIAEMLGRLPAAIGPFIYRIFFRSK